MSVTQLLKSTVIKLPHLFLLGLPVIYWCFLCRCSIKGTQRKSVSLSQPGSSLHSVLNQCKSFGDLLTNHVFDILYHLGPHLHSDPVLLCEIVRIGRACLKDSLPGGIVGDASLSINILQKVSYDP